MMTCHHKWHYRHQCKIPSWYAATFAAAYQKGDPNKHRWSNRPDCVKMTWFRSLFDWYHTYRIPKSEKGAVIQGSHNCLVFVLGKILQNCLFCHWECLQKNAPLQAVPVQKWYVQILCQSTPACSHHSTWHSFHDLSCVCCLLLSLPVATIKITR